MSIFALAFFVSPLFVPKVQAATFGLTSTGSTSYPATNYGDTNIETASTPAIVANTIQAANKITVSSPITIQSFALYFGATYAHNLKFAIYPDSGGTPVGQTLVKQTGAYSVSGTGWVTVTLNSTDYIYLPAGTYWLFYLGDTTAGTIRRAVATTDYWATGTYSSGFSTTCPSMTSETQGQYSFYATSVKVKGYAKATKVTLSDSNSTINSVEFYSHATGNFRLGIYSDSGSAPGTLQWESGSVAATASAWNAVNISSGTPTSLKLNSGTYWLVWQWDSANSGPSYTAGSSGDGNYITQAYGSFPSSWSGGTSSSEKYSVYVNYNTPGTVADAGAGSPSGSTITWTNPGNATTSDDTYATASFTTSLSSSSYLKATNFGFTIPSGSTIQGITVGIERKASGNELQDKYVQIIKSDGSIGTTNKALAVDWGTETTISYGSTSDLWGETWTYSDINNSNFGVALSVYEAGSSAARTASVDSFTITITYTSDVAPNAPTRVSPGDGSSTNDNTPTLSAHYSDPDAGDTGTTNYRIATSQANCLAGTVVASGTSTETTSNGQDTTWTPGSSIGGDATYYWCAQNNDGVLTSAWTSMGNFILDATAPIVSTVTSSLADGSYGVGQTVSVQVVFNEVVTVTGTPQFTLATGTPATTTVDYSSGSGSTTLVFNYTVAAGNNSTDLDYAATTSLALNGGTIKDAVGNNATLTLAAPGAANSLGANKAIVIDTTAAVLAQVTPVTSPTSDSTPDYTFSSTEGGTISYAGGCSSTTTIANSGSNTITFATLADGTYPSCTIKVTDGAGNVSNILPVSSFTIDSTSPTVTNVTSSHANGSFTIGEVIPIQVTFSETVNVATGGGTPQLTLSTGSPSTTAVNYTSGTGTATLTFNYTVSAGNTSADLDYAATTSLALNSGTIKDATGNNAVLTLVSPGAPGSLGANKNIIIDTTAPNAANSLTWAEASPHNSTLVNANWTKSDSADLADQKIQFYSDATCTTTSGSLIDLASNIVQTRAFTGADGTTYTYKITSIDNATNQTTSACSSSMLIDATPPHVTSVVWNDIDISTNFTATDTIVVTFNKPMNKSTITNANVDSRLGLSGGHTFGTTGNGMGTSWNGPGTALTVTFGTDMIVVSGDTINPTDDVTDVAGNSDATPAPLPILDYVSPTVTNIVWNDLSSPPTTISPGDTIVMIFSEPMNTSTITTGNVNTNLVLSAGHTFGTTGVGTSWNGLDTTLTITLGSETNIVNGDTIDPTANVTDVAGNPVATAPFAIIDTVSPYVTSVVWNDLDSNTYISGTDTVVINFSEGMNKLTIDETNVSTRLHLRDSGDTTDHTFGTTGVGASWNGPGTVLTVTLGTDMTVVNGDTIDPTASVFDVAGNSDATPAPFPILDNVSPIILTVNTAHADGTFGITEVLNLTVKYSENVNVTGTPTLALNSGGTAIYSGGGGTDTLTFSNTVVVPDTSSDLDYVATNSLNLSGGTIKDAANNNADNTLPAVGTFAGAHAIVINTTIPAVSSVNSNTANGSYTVGQVVDVRINFSEAVDVVVTGGTPRILLETGATDRYAAYDSGSGSITLIFSYTVQAGDTSPDLDYVAVNSLELNGATIKGVGGNNADLSLPSPAAPGSLGANEAIIIDTTPPDAPSTPDLAAADDTGFSDSDNITKNTSALTFSGTAEVGSLVKLFVDGGDSGSSNIADGSGNWIIDISLAAGVHSITATATDAAGNTSLASSALSVTIDTTAPVVASVDSDLQSYNLATPSPHTIKITFSEDIYSLSTVSVLLSGGGQTVNDCGDADAKTFCFNYAIPSGIGATQTITIAGAKDIAENTIITDSSHTFLVDTNPPVIAITAPTKTSSAAIADTTIHMTDNIGVLAADVTVDASTTAGTSGLVCTQTNPQTVNCTIQIDTSGNLTMHAVDSKGNTATRAENGYLIDTIAPTVPGIPQAVVGADPTLQVWSWTASTDTGSGVSHYHWRVDGGPSGIANTATVTTNLTAGNWTFHVKAEDYAGNQSAEKSSLLTVFSSSINRVIVDCTVPLVQVITPDGVSSPTLDLSPVTVPDGSLLAATVSCGIILKSLLPSATVTVNIPAGAVIKGAPGIWPEVIVPPITTTATTALLPAGSQVALAIVIGHEVAPLDITTKGVRIFLEGQAGKRVGYISNNIFSEIASRCTDDSQDTGDALGAGGDCKIDSGSDLVVWTKHFTKFVTYNLVPSSTNNSSSNSSASGCNSSVTDGKPDLFEIRVNNKTATLYFAPPGAPYDTFYIAYSRKPDSWEYGTEFNQSYSGGVIKQTINLLSPNTKYYFKIRAGNGCAAGSWGNTMTVTTTSSASRNKTFYKNVYYTAVWQKVVNILLPKRPANLSPSPMPKPELVAPTPAVGTPTPKPTPAKRRFCILWWCF